jgi:hypothetical protein
MESGKFMREIKEKHMIENASKDPNFLNGQWT